MIYPNERTKGWGRSFKQVVQRKAGRETAVEIGIDENRRSQLARCEINGEEVESNKRKFRDL